MRQSSPRRFRVRGAITYIALATVMVIATLSVISQLSTTDGPANPSPVDLANRSGSPGMSVESLTIPVVERASLMAIDPLELVLPAEAMPELICPGKICGVVEELGVGPRPGAVCNLFRGEAPMGLAMASDIKDRAMSPAASVITDESGAFELPAAEGYWRLEVEYEGLATWREDSVASGAYRHVLLNQQQNLVLAIRDEQGAPVADATCRLLVDLYRARSRTTARIQTLSDWEGRAVIPLQAGESWFIEVAHPSYRPVWFRAPPLSGARVTQKTVVLSKGIRIIGKVIDTKGRTPAGAQVLVDVAGNQGSQLVSCDIEGRFDTGAVLHPTAELHLTGRAPGYGEGLKLLDLETTEVTNGTVQVDIVLELLGVTVVGQVVTLDGTLPGPVGVFLQPWAEGSYGRAGDLVPNSVRWRTMTTTDDQGRFTFSGLKGYQQYRVLAVPRQGYSPVQARLSGAEPGTTYHLGPLELTAAGKIFGFAHHENGAPAPHLMVSALATITQTGRQRDDPSFFRSQLGDRQDTFTNQQGRFELAMFDAVENISYELYWGEGWTINGDHLVDTFSFSPGQAIGPVEIVVPAEETNDGSLRGTVVDSLGDPVEAILIELWNGPADERAIGQGFLGGSLSRTDGTFALSGLTIGKELRVTATDLRGRFEAQTVQETISPLGSTLDFVLRPASTSPSKLEGVVQDVVGQPLPGIDLKLLLSPMLVRCASCMSFDTMSDELGRFSFGHVADGQHVISAVDRQSVHPSTAVDVRPGTPLIISMGK